MSTITQTTRQMSFDDIQDKTKIRYIQILNRLDKPSLSELADMGMVKAIDKKKCEYTGKTVAVYERTLKGFEALNMNHITRIY